MPGTPVNVNVYDLGEMNGYISWLGVGVYHSGVEVHGKEYAFGGVSCCLGPVLTTPQAITYGSTLPQVTKSGSIF
jgi:PPPDE putative peptidase domain